MPTVRNITVNIFEPNGQPIVGARVVIELVGLGIDNVGSISPGRQDRVTDANGVCHFQLWQNHQELSDTYYEISSSHPDTGRPIHRREIFRVYGTDANVKDLLNLAPVPPNPNAQLLAQIAADRAAAHNAAMQAAAILAQVQALYDAIGGGGGAGTAPIVPNQNITTVAGISRIVTLGPSSDIYGPIQYTSDSANFVITGRMGVFTADSPGPYAVIVTATNAIGLIGIGLISINNVSPQNVIEYALGGVQVGGQVIEYTLPGIQVI